MLFFVLIIAHVFFVNSTDVNVGTACIPASRRDYRKETNCILSGWGRVNSTMANRLQKVSKNTNKNKEICVLTLKSKNKPKYQHKRKH